MPSPAEHAEQARFDQRVAEREELKRLRAENERLSQWQSEAETFMTDALEIEQSLRAENERLRARLGEAAEMWEKDTVEKDAELGRLLLENERLRAQAKRDIELITNLNLRLGQLEVENARLGADRA